MRAVYDLSEATGRRPVVVIDSRPRARCLSRTLAGARCLPPDAFLGPRGQLANFRNIRWLLGTADLGGKETAVVVGDQRTARDFVAGILYLAGQRRVTVVRRPLTPWLASHPWAAGPGLAHGMVRLREYAVWPRTRFIVFRDPLARSQPTTSLRHRPDGCPSKSREQRPADPRCKGQIPVSRSLFFARLVQGGAHPPRWHGPLIVSAQDAYRSIAYFAALRLRGWPVDVFIGGMRDGPAPLRKPRPATTGPAVSRPGLVDTKAPAALSASLVRPNRRVCAAGTPVSRTGVVMPGLWSYP